MPVSLWQFTRDANGVIAGQWRLFHARSDFSGYLGLLPFQAGVSQRPVAAAELQRLVAAAGHTLARAEPWTEVPARAAELALDIEVDEDTARCSSGTPSASTRVA